MQNTLPNPMLKSLSHLALSCLPGKSRSYSIRAFQANETSEARMLWLIDQANKHNNYFKSCYEASKHGRVI